MAFLDLSKRRPWLCWRLEIVLYCQFFNLYYKIFCSNNKRKTLHLFHSIHVLAPAFEVVITCTRQLKFHSGLLPLITSEPFAIWNPSLAASNISFGVSSEHGYCRYPVLRPILFFFFHCCVINFFSWNYRHDYFIIRVEHDKSVERLLNRN